jgi:hypothetical protein
MFKFDRKLLPVNSEVLISGLAKPGEVGDFFALVSMKSPNFCQKAEVLVALSVFSSPYFFHQ